MKDDRKILEAIAATLYKFPTVEKAVLFGSRARGDDHARSDYDIAVYGALDRPTMTAVRYEITEEMPTLHKIDLLFMCELTDASLINSIEKEGICFYGQAAK